MKTISKWTFGGLIMGVLLCGALAVTAGSANRGLVGHSQGTFFGIPVLELTRVANADGSSTGSLKPLVGMLVPLLLPTVVVLALALAMRGLGGARPQQAEAA